jgi:hypothetical protein
MKALHKALAEFVARRTQNIRIKNNTLIGVKYVESFTVWILPIALCKKK